MRISSVQPVAVTRAALSQNQSGAGSSPEASLVRASYWMPRGLARNICAVRPSAVPSTKIPAVVGVGANVVAVAERSADRLRVGIVELEADVEEALVVGKPGDARHLRGWILSPGLVSTQSAIGSTASFQAGSERSPSTAIGPLARRIAIGPARRGGVTAGSPARAPPATAGATRSRARQGARPRGVGRRP